MITAHSIAAVIGGLALELRPTDAELTMDEGWSPFVQARLVCPIEDTAQLTALDPRTPRRGTLTVRQEFGRVDRIRDLSRRFKSSTLQLLTALFSGGSLASISGSLYWDWTSPTAPYKQPFTRSFDLGLRSRDLDHEAGTVTLTFASDEALLQDNAHVSIIPLYVPAVNIYEAVQYVLARIGTALYESSAAEAANPFESAKNVWEPGQSAWDWIAPILQTNNVRLWCDELRRWHLTVLSNKPGATIALSSTSNITRARDSINRDAEFFKAVLVTYEWNDAEGKAQKAYDLAFQPPWLPSTQQRIKQVTYRRRYPGPGAAARLLRAVLGRGRVIEVAALNDYAAEPGRAVSVSLPSTPLQSGRVSAVTWRWPADEMDVRMRELVDAGGIETEYTPVPDPEEEP